MKENTKKADAKKIRCYACGKEMSEDEVIVYMIPSCCGVDEVMVCKECSKELKKYADEDEQGDECGCTKCGGCR